MIFLSSVGFISGSGSCLVAVTEEMFEPLHHATPKDLMLQALFLLAAASACRVSEIHAFCIDTSFLIQNRLSLHLALNPAFLPKTSREVPLSSTLSLSLLLFTQNQLGLWNRVPT